MTKQKQHPIDLIDKFIDGYHELKQARELLLDLYIEIGPYKDGKIKESTWDKVRDYFDFDDSE